MPKLLTLLLLLSSTAASAQTLGGNAVFNFLKLPSSPVLSAAGGVNVSLNEDEIGLAIENPGLLRPAMHSYLQAGFNFLPASTQAFQLAGSIHSAKLETSFSGKLFFINHGSIPQTDASGNVSGEFRPVDFSIQLGASRSYLTKWHYGGQLKFIQSAYGGFKSSAIALDAGLHFEDSAALFTAGLLAKNMGLQLTAYGDEREDLPFDLQIGLSKRLENAPFGFSLTAHQLQNFNINYRDTVFDNDNEYRSPNDFTSRLLNHVVLATHIFLGKQLEAHAGYNFLRRYELNVGEVGNGLSGFSFGFRLKFDKLQILYARSQYQKNIAYNQFGLTMKLNRYFSFGEL